MMVETTPAEEVMHATEAWLWKEKGIPPPSIAYLVVESLMGDSAGTRACYQVYCVSLVLIGALSYHVLDNDDTAHPRRRSEAAIAKKATKKREKRVCILSDRVQSMFPELTQPGARELVLKHALHALDEHRIEDAMNALLDGT